MDRYVYDQAVPLAKPYNDHGITNAYYKGLDTINNEQVLISKFQQPNQKKILSKEKRLKKLKEISHHNLAKIHNIFVDSDNKTLFVILEWCEGGCLYDYQKVQSTFDSQFVLKIIKNITQGLSMIHDNNQYHQFINMENIEFDKNGQPKLTYKCLYPKTIYLSPEQKTGKKIKENDIFSLGILAYKLLFSTVPFQSNNLNEQIESIRQGLKFPKNQNQLFPLAVNSFAKELLSGMANHNLGQRMQCSDIIKFINSIFKEPELHLKQDIQFELYKRKYYNSLIKYSSQQRTVILALKPDSKQVFKVELIKAKISALKKYQQQVLKFYAQRKQAIGIFNVIERFFYKTNYLVIVSPYDNQGSVQFYLQNGGTLPKSSNNHMKKFMNELTTKLKSLPNHHQHLSFNTLVIKKGQFYIHYPPFLTQQYVKFLQSKKNQIDFIAPQIKQGKDSKNADEWSLAAFKFYLQNESMPTFDRNKKLKIPNRHKKNQEEILFYQHHLIEDPQKRGTFLLRSQKKQIEYQIDQVPVVSPRKNAKINPQKRSNDQQQQRKNFGELISQKFVLLLPLEKHWTKPLRVGLKILIGLIFLLFLFYFNLFLINGQLLVEHSLYQAKVVNIRAFDYDSNPAINYTLVTKTPQQTYNLFYNSTLTVLRDEYKCVLNGYSVGSNVVQIINREGFTAYQIFGILIPIINMILFCISLSKMDFCKVYLIQDFQNNSFQVLWNWLFINLCLAAQISLTYLLYGSLFHMALEPCLAKATLTAVEFLLKDWQFSFNIRYIWVYLGLIYSYFLTIFFIVRPHQATHKVLKIIMIIIFLIGIFCRIMGGSGGYIAWEKQSVFGKLGQLLSLIIGLLGFLIDYIFACYVNSTKQTINNGQANKVASISHDEINLTQNSFLPD